MSAAPISEFEQSMDDMLYAAYSDGRKDERDEIAKMIAERAHTPRRPVVTEEMVSRFLTWRLPDDFAPDAGIAFNGPSDVRFWPVGTNLLTAPQARQMLAHVLAGAQQ